MDSFLKENYELHVANGSDTWQSLRDRMDDLPEIQEFCDAKIAESQERSQAKPETNKHVQRTVVR
jgi:hypothetical protein